MLWLQSLMLMLMLVLVLMLMLMLMSLTRLLNLLLVFVLLTSGSYGEEDMGVILVDVVPSRLCRAHGGSGSLSILLSARGRAMVWSRL